MLRIRLQNKYFCGNGYYGYKIVLIKSNTARDSSAIEELGYYEASLKIAKNAKLSLDWSRLVYWLGQGVQINKSVLKLLQHSMFLKKLPCSKVLETAYGQSKTVVYTSDFVKKYRFKI